MQVNVHTTSKIENKFLFAFYGLFVIIDLLVSFGAWFTWGINLYYWGCISSVVGLVFFITVPLWYTRKLPLIWVLLLLFSVVTGSLNYPSIIAILINLSPIIPLIFLLVLRPVYQERLLSYIRKTLSVVLGVSLAGWFLYLLGVQTPWLPVGFGDSDQNTYQYLYENHFIFLRNITDITDRYGVPRFHAIFIEPGYLGCLMAMIICSDSFKINKQNAVFIITLLLTFSLAGYIIFAFSLLMHSLKYSQKRLKYILSSFILISIVYLFGLYYNGGDNPIKKSIIDRLEYNAMEHSISGYNRSREETDYYFWNQFVSSDKLLFGDSKNVNAGDVDWKTYIISRGLISFLLFIGFILYPVVHYRRTRYDCLVLSLTYLLIFISTMHLAISLMYLSIYAFGVNRKKQFLFLE